MYLNGLFRSLSFFMQPSITCAPEDGSKGAVSCAASWGASCGGSYAAAAAARAAVLQATASQVQMAGSVEASRAKTARAAAAAGRAVASWLGWSHVVGPLRHFGVLVRARHQHGLDRLLQRSRDALRALAWACGAAGQSHLLDDRADILSYERALLGVALHLHRSTNAQNRNGGKSLATRLREA